MFTEAWSLPFLFAFPLSGAIVAKGKIYESDLLSFLGSLFIISCFAFVVESAIYGEVWWHGLAIFALSYLVVVPLSLIEAIVENGLCSKYPPLLLLWTYFEFVVCVAALIFSHYFLYF